MRYPDPDIIALDARFRRYIIGNTSIRRLHTGTMWAEGPAWNGVGRYLVWSDIPNNVQLRLIDEDSRVSVFRSPSGYSNGNTFDAEGRQLSCEHGGRRVVRYEYSGAVTVIAEKSQGKRLSMIRLPENCANVCVGGAKRNRLFMTASQSLYAVYIDTQGAGVA